VNGCLIVKGRLLKGVMEEVTYILNGTRVTEDRTILEGWSLWTGALGRGEWLIETRMQGFEHQEDF
jgi:hypothetical protein